MANKTNNEVATVNTDVQIGGFTNLAQMEALKDEMMESCVSMEFSMDRIKMPSGVSKYFTVPGEGEEEEKVTEIVGIVLHHHHLNAYYATKYTGGSNPPDCGSYDGLVGVGNPGGSCKNCPYNVFGSGENGAKACKNRRRLYLLREGDIFPMILSLPTDSLKGFTRYLMRILPKYKNSNAVVTRFTLKKATSGKGIAYSQAQLSVARVLSPEEHALIAAMTEQVKAMSVNVGYDSEETVPPNVDPETGEIIAPLN